jgi:quercetin dioxygenase-like cupin family protein
MKNRIFEHPSMKDKITVLKTSEDTSGEYILVEVELKKGGGNPLHAHSTFNEEFIPVEGELGIGLGKKNLRLNPGETAVAEINQWHRFYNPGDKTIRFHVKISPAQDRFLECMSINYGLANDGLTNKKGIPKKLDHLAFLLDHSDTRLKGVFSLIAPILLRRARKVKRKGMGEALIKKYCKGAA